MFWFAFGVVVVASFLSPSLGVLAAIALATLYAGLLRARRQKIDGVRVMLILLSPLIGLVGGAVLFLLGPGF